MKKNVLVFGLISGLIAALTMVVSMEIGYNSSHGAGSMLIGFGSMIVAFSFIFVGIKNYRDKYNGGYVSFGSAFKMGFLIALIGSSMYVLAWGIDYSVFHPDFMEKYTAAKIAQAQTSHLSPAELAATKTEMANMVTSYKNPLVFVMYTYMEILPVGILMALFAALILKRKPGNMQAVAAA